MLVCLRFWKLIIFIVNWRFATPTAYTTQLVCLWCWKCFLVRKLLPDRKISWIWTSMNFNSAQNLASPREVQILRQIDVHWRSINVFKVLVFSYESKDGATHRQGVLFSMVDIHLSAVTNCGSVLPDANRCETHSIFPCS